MHHHDTWHDGWYWWATDREHPGWGYPEAAALPHAQWKELAHTFNYDPLVFKEYPTVRGAVEALIAAWDVALVTPGEAPVKAPKRKAAPKKKRAT